MSTREQKLVNLLREPKSQQWMNNRLGYDYNKYSDWERGRTKVLWNDFLDICEVLKIPVKEYIYECYGFDFDPRDISAYFYYFLGTKSADQIAKMLNLSVRQVRNLLSGNKQLDLSVVLDILNSGFYDLDIFLNKLIPELAEIDREKRPLDKKSLERISQYPWIEIIPRVIEMLKESSSIEKVAYILKAFNDLEISEIMEILESLVRSGFISMDSQGKLVRNTRFLHTLPVTQDPLKVRLYWHDILIDYIQKRKKKSDSLFWGYKLFTCTDEQYAEIEKAYMTFYHKIDEIIDSHESGPKRAEKMCMVNIQLLDLIKTLGIEDFFKAEADP